MNAFLQDVLLRFLIVRIEGWSYREGRGDFTLRAWEGEEKVGPGEGTDPMEARGRGMHPEWRPPFRRMR